MHISPDRLRTTDPDRPSWSRSARRLLQGLALLTSVCALTLTIAPSSASASPSLAPPAVSRSGYIGHAFGTYVSIGGVAKSGPSSVVALGCGPPAGFRARNSAVSSSFAPVLSTGTLATTGSTSESPTRTATTATVQNVSALNGLITADAIKSVSISSHDATGYHTSSEGSVFANLRIAGVPVVGSPAPNTQLPLPGIGTVTLNEQHSTVTANSASLTVFAIHVVVNQASVLGYKVGTNAIVSGAVSGLTDPAGGFVSGGAYGTQVNIAGSLLTSGPTFSVALPCGGTNGVVLTNSGAGIKVPVVASVGAITNTAVGTKTPTTARGETTSTVASANLLNGLIKVTAVKADVHVARVNGKTTLSAAGSTFGSITVNGKSLDIASIKANTLIRIAGVGNLYLSRRVSTPIRLEVRMIEVVLAPGNIFGMPAGSDVRVAVAAAGGR